MIRIIIVDDEILSRIGLQSFLDGKEGIVVSGIFGEAEEALHFLEEKGIYVSSGSACAKGGASHVLSAMGLSHERADSAIRLSFGRYNTPEEVPVFLAALEEGLERFRR